MEVMESVDGEDWLGRCSSRRIGLDGGCTLSKNVSFVVFLPSMQNQELSTEASVSDAVALSRYQDIIESKDAWDIEYDSLEPGVTKPTKAAIRVNDLLETVTGMLLQDQSGVVGD